MVDLLRAYGAARTVGRDRRALPCAQIDPWIFVPKYCAFYCEVKFCRGRPFEIKESAGEQWTVSKRRQSVDGEHVHKAAVF